MPETPFATLEHADFRNLGAGNYREGQMRHLVEERARKGDEVYEKVRKIVVNALEHIDLQAFQRIEQIPCDDRGEYGDYRQNQADSRQGANTVAPPEPGDNLLH